jgi:Flp pilus assembly protein TadG
MNASGTQKEIRAMLHCLTAALASLRRLARSRDGNVAMLVGLFAIPLVLAGGIATDVGRAYLVKIRLGAALDAAALAVGSETNHTATELAADLQHYFTANYPSTALGTSVTVAPVPSTADLAATTVNYRAQATVPMVFMPLIGINNINVSVTAQTKKTTGLEIAVVLDNTGSMLCGANDGSDSACSPDVVAADTSCTNSSNNSRICTLINASTTFVNTLTSAINSSQQLYLSIVPYVTTVNVGDSFCSGATSCTHITATSGNFTDLRGNMMPVTPIIGTTTNASSTISSVSMLTPSGSVSGTAAIQAGMYIYGHGIPSGATVSSVSSSSITISSNATLTFTGNSLAVGPNSGNTTTQYTDPTTCTTTGTWTTSSSTVTSVVNTANTCVAAGMVVTSTSSGIPTSPATTVSNCAPTCGSLPTSGQATLSATPTVAHSGAPLTFSLAGNTTNGNATITTLKGTNASLNSIVVGMGICGTGVPGPTCISIAGGTPPTTYVTSITGSPPTSLTMNANATSTNTSDIVTLTNLGATTTTGSSTISNVSFTTPPSPGQIIVGNGIPANTTITAVTGTAAQFAAGTGSLTISQNATTPSNFSSATGTCCNTTLVAFTPLTYDSTYNSASPAGSSTTTNWGGCVIEPTSSGENASGTGVLSVAGSPDTSEPASGTSWYPFYWVKDSTNSWASGTVLRQDTTTEIQGHEISDCSLSTGPTRVARFPYCR